MKTILYRLGSLAAIVFLAAACSKEPNPSPTPTPSSKDEVKITSGSSFTILADGGTATVQFSSSGKWTAALSNDRAASWLSLSSTSGEKGNASLTLTAAKSEETEDRSATVRITCGNASASVTVTQKQKDALTQTPSKTQFGAEGGNFTIEVKANIEYEIEVGADWIHVISTKAMTSSTATLSVDKNEDTRKREGTVMVKSAIGSEKITVYQEAGAPSVILSAESVSVMTEGGTFTVDVSTNVDVAMAITSGADWLSEVSTKAMSTHTYTFQAAANDSYDAREGKITFKNAESGIEASVTVTQMQKDAIIVSQPVYEIGADGGNISIQAATNVELDISVSASWVHQISTKSLQTVTYDFTVDSNPGYDDRECVITFSSVGSSSQPEFTQNSPWSLIGTINGDNWTRDIGMKTDGKWHVANGVSISGSDEFKFRKNSSWTENLGSITYSLTTISANSPVSLNQDGGNMKIAAGTYDIYLSPDRKTAYFLTAGTPFTYDGYGTSGSGISQSVTIRQDGADGFLVDFQEKYTLSARSQNLELRARSSVSIEATSHADWISVVNTKALSDRSVTLQISENKADGARTGIVTVQAPALGINQDVTIVQVGTGDIYIPDDAFRAFMLANFDTDGDGLLSKEECEAVESINLLATDDPSVNNIESLQGIEYFVNLVALNINMGNGTGSSGKLTGTLDLSANTKLWGIYIYNCGIDTLDISTCTELRTISLDQVTNLKEIIFPKDEGLFVQSITIRYSLIGPELDLSIYPDLDYIYLYGNPNLNKLWLTTGLNPQNIDLQSGCIVAYKGDNPNVEAPFKDPVLKEMMMNSDYFKSYDWNGDGVFSYRELERLQSFILWPDYFNRMDESKVITSFEDIAMFKNIKSFAMSDLYERVNAPLPDCLADLTEITLIQVDDCDITGPIPESVCKMDKLLYLDLINTKNTGPLPSDIGNIPNLKDLVINDCPNMDGPIPKSLLTDCTYDYISLNGCNFDDTFIVVPSSRLLDHTVQGNNFSFLGTQEREYTLPGGGTYYEYPCIYFRSEADGHGAVHPDGEVELYHAATKGAGIDFFITGDGFTAENNTVGGTLETYMKHLAEVTLSMEPYNKLKEYFNVWLIYAHSEREGTGYMSSEGLKFSSYHPNPLRSTICYGDNDYAIRFAKEATGREVSSGTVAIIMNSSLYGGTCHFAIGGIYDSGLAVGYTPAAWMMDLTYVHETLGHGFGHLDDEYDASGQSTSYSYMGTYWPSGGFGANMDATEEVRWSSFISDSRYSAENIGAYATSKRVSTTFGSGYRDYYRPTANSVMRSQWDEGGNRFNAPSREAIWQRVQLLANPEKQWESWEDYVINGYDREEFINFDLMPPPASSPSIAPKTMRNPEHTLPDGRKIGQLPPHSPPVILNKR